MVFRVLHCIGSMNRGGAETFIMNVYRNIDRTKLQFDFLLNTMSSDYEEEIRSLGGRVFYIPPRNEGYIKYKRNLMDFFYNNSKNYIAIHQHVSSLTSLEPLISAKRFGIKNRIIHAHSTKQKGKKIHLLLHYLNKIILRRVANNFLACSDLASEWLYKYTTAQRRAVIINNGVNVSEFKFNPEKRAYLRKSMNLEGKIVLGHIGRFCEVKNHKFIVEVFKQYLTINSNSHLLLIGVGELQPFIIDYVSFMCIENKVTFLGLRSDIADLLNVMDIFLFPSLYEGLPVALIEAQSAGVKIYASNKISRQAKVSENVAFIPLEKGATYWAKYIHETYKSFVRTDISDKVVSAGFDSKQISAHIVHNIYKL